MKRILLLVIIGSVAIMASAQYPALTWANKLGGKTADYGYSITTDAIGNVYSTGYFTGIANMAPGAGILNLTSAGLNDIFISKSDSSGIFQWTKRIGGKSLDMGRSIKVDSDGNIYITGYFSDTVDFDPGIAEYTLASLGGADIFILKLDAAGDFLWAKQLGSNKGDYGYSITLDPMGNVYTTGDFAGTVDFDPGAGYNYLTSNGSQDAYILKMDKDGNALWAKTIGGAEYDHGNSIVADALGNVYTIGYFQETADIDPGPGVITFSHPNTQGIFILKLDAAGNYKWAGDFGGTYANDGFTIVLSTSGYLYATGYFQGTADFDPGPDIYNLNSKGGKDVYVLKLDTMGNFKWARTIGGKSSDIGLSIAVDAKDNCYVTGTIESSADFDPGAGIHNLTLKGQRDVFITKLDAAGDYVWAQNIGGISSDVEGYSIALDDKENFYCTGQFNGKIDFDPTTGLFDLTSGADDIFIYKMNQNSTVNNTETHYQFTSSISLYPNPSSGLFNIGLPELSSPTIVEIYNTMGALVYHQAVSAGQNSIDLSGYANGLYIVNIIAENKVIAAKKIIIE